MIKNRRIGHIGIATNDVERDVQWYVDVLGFEVTGKFQNGNDTVYFLKNDDVVLNRITAMYGQQNNSAKDSVIKMYQENIDEEIKNLQNISSEEASEKIIFIILNHSKAFFIAWTH